jgi:CHAD domain-containing protein
VRSEAALDLDATYVDTPDLQLVRNGASLRRRTGEGPPRWTLKLPSGRDGDVLLRRELDVDDPGHEVPEALRALTTGWVRRAPLGPVAVIRSHRERLRLLGADGATLAEIDDDEVSVIDAGHVAARFREVEVELAEGGSPDLLTLVTEALVAAGAGAPDPTSKVARALGPRALAPPELSVTPPGPDATVAEAVGAALRRSVGQVVAWDHVVRLDDDVEGVHKVRVGTRRLRSDLTTLEPVLDQAWAEDLRGRLAELAARLGAVRDTDVLLERLWGAVEELREEDRPGAAVVVQRLEDERRAHLGSLHATMSGAAYVELLDDLVAAALRPCLSPAGREPAAEVLPALVRPRWRRLRRAVEGLGDAPSDDALHRVRILAKRARYASELVAPVVGDDAADLAACLAALQDVLGELHDAVVAEAWLRDHRGALTHDEGFAAGELAALQRADADQHRRAWPAAWAACDRKALTRWFR